MTALEARLHVPSPPTPPHTHTSRFYGNYHFRYVMSFHLFLHLPSSPTQVTHDVHDTVY